jgi:uncharacterized protein YybS (DUF2232 family)
MGYARDYVVVGKVIIVIVVIAYVEETVSFKPEWLMNLKIKTNSFHELVGFLCGRFCLFTLCFSCGEALCCIYLLLWLPLYPK